jgi:hypothetical protein
MGTGGSDDFTVTLSETSLGTIVSNDDIFGPFAFSGTLQPGNYTISAFNSASDTPFGSGSTIATNGNYTLFLVPEPSMPALFIAGIGLLLLFWRRDCRLGSR